MREGLEQRLGPRRGFRCIISTTVKSSHDWTKHWGTVAVQLSRYWYYIKLDDGTNHVMVASMSGRWPNNSLKLGYIMAREKLTWTFSVLAEKSPKVKGF